MEKAKQLNQKQLLTRLNTDINTIVRYFKIHKTVVEMLDTRGYLITQAEVDSTEDLNGFLNFLNDKKHLDEKEFLEDLILQLLEHGNLINDIENRNKVKIFVSDEIPELILQSDGFGHKDIILSVKKLFKVNPKSLRPLETVVEEMLQRRKEMKAIESLNHLYKNPNGELIQSYYYYNSDSEKKSIGKVVADILAYQKKESSLRDILFIADEHLNTQMSEDLKRFTQNMKISIFLGDHLLFNITKHFLVPKHHLLNEEEYKAFVATEKNILRKLPIIFETDPIARFYGAKPGQIFKIIRENLSDDSMVRYSEFYRLVTTEVKK